MYLYADGLYLKAGGDQDKIAVLVVLGVDEQGNKELLAIEQAMARVRPPGARC